MAAIPVRQTTQTSCRNPVDLATSLLWRGNSLCREEEKHTMCELGVQIANCGLDAGEALLL